MRTRYPEPVTKPRTPAKAVPEENEVKIAVAGAAAMRALLRERGFQVSARRVFEQNIVLDDPKDGIRASGRLLRLRSVGTKVLCTFKGPDLPGPHKRRQEREFHSDNLEETLAVFAGLGFNPSWRYEKYRTEFTRDGDPGIVLLDETPIGTFLELEGPVRWIDRTAKELGFSRESYILLSYARLHAQWRTEFGEQRTDMVFVP
ncbi:MAG TPA: class IV adenylate cyclase [Bryobacteraceae bacterium]|nr:class IV adenylate cyclase [Bryobacteraceae bacterium]